MIGRWLLIALAASSLAGCKAEPYAAAAVNGTMRPTAGVVLPKPVLATVAVSLILASSLPFLPWHWGQQATPSIVLSGAEEASLTADLDLLKNLDLLEDVDTLEQLDASF